MMELPSSPAKISRSTVTHTKMTAHTSKIIEDIEPLWSSSTSFSQPNDRTVFSLDQLMWMVMMKWTNISCCLDLIDRGTVRLELFSAHVFSSFFWWAKQRVVLLRLCQFSFLIMITVNVSCFYVCCKCWYAWLHMLNCALHSNCPFPVAFSVYPFQLYCAPLPWIKLCKLLMNRAPEGCCFPFFLHMRFCCCFFQIFVRPIQVAKEKSKIFFFF